MKKNFHIFRALAQRGVPVPLEADQQPCSSRQTSLATPLVCVPLLGKNQEYEMASTSNSSGPANELRFEFRNLAKLVNECLNGEQAIDSQSRQMIIRLEEWLSEEQCRDTLFVDALFRVSNPTCRIRLCVHNPAYNPRLTYFCHSVLDQNGKAEVHRRTSELEEAVKKSNTVRARMIEMEKYDKYQINPIFGVCTSYRRRLNAPEYYVKGRKAVSRPSSNPQRSPTEFWEHQFPLHKYAFEGNHVKVRELLKQGHNPNELDNDCWTPLHYCAFYNRLQACEVLMLHPKTSVNAVNKTGATALHFAALNGHVFLVELILSHQFVDINIEDNNGKTALDLCERVPRSDWQESAYLLANQLRPNKLEVQLVGGASLQIEAPNSQPTAGQLRDAVLAVEGLASAEAARIFAIWVTSQRLSLQLKAEQKVHVHLEKWADHLEKWGDPLEPGMPLEEDQVRIVLRRDARTLLGDEQVLARKSPVAISLLYGEAEHNFLAGLYPCDLKCYVQLAAIVLHRLYGIHIQNTLDATILAQILPKYLIPSVSSAFNQLVSKIRAAHRELGNTNLVQLQLLFLKYCWSLNVYGCTFFKAFMLMSKPLRGNLPVHVGVNDWGMSVVNAKTYKQVAAMELKSLEVKYTANTNYIEVTSRKRDFLATITTPQAMLINNLLKQLKTKVEAARSNNSNSIASSPSANSK